MDLSDELMCRGDLYFNFDTGSKGRESLSSLEPVDFMDSTSGSSDAGGLNDPSSTASQIKTISSFLDDILTYDKDDGVLSQQITNSLLAGSEGINGPCYEPISISTDDLEAGSQALGLIAASFQWSDGSTNGTTTTGSSPDTNWLSGHGHDSHVTTLTNLIDQPYASYEPAGHEKMEYYSGGNGSGMVSEDLISSTYPNQDSILGMDHNLSSTLSWHKQNSPDSQFIMYDAQGTAADSSTLLRTALQGGGSGKGQLEPQQSGTNSKPCDSMIELRRYLSGPPMTLTTSSPSPTSTSSAGGESHYQLQLIPQSNSAHHYEYKPIDPMFGSTAIPVADEANLPNVEELIMNRIDFSHNPGNSATFYNGNQTLAKKLELVSERRINSTTLSSKWTYATPNSNGQPKPIKRRAKKQQPAKAQGQDSNVPALVLQGGDMNEGYHQAHSSSSGGSGSGSPNSSNGGNGAATSRKERSLHYCNICNKGFKDKYSVNVHIRTHSGEKPFDCDICGKKFRQKAHLAKHKQTHAPKPNGQVGKAPKARMTTG